MHIEVSEVIPLYLLSLKLFPFIDRKKRMMIMQIMKY